MGEDFEVPTDELDVTRWPWPHFPRVSDPSVGVDQTTYDNLARYTKYASGAYQVLCPRPMGNTLVAQVRYKAVTQTSIPPFCLPLTLRTIVHGPRHLDAGIYRKR